MLLSYNQLIRIQREGVITDSPPDHVNGTSIDILLGKELLIEKPPVTECPECGQPIADPRLAAIGISYIDPYSDVRCTACPYVGPHYTYFRPVDVAKKQPLSMRKVSCEGEGYVILPGESVLGHSVEQFYLPDNITAEYRLKSSMARVFLEHLHAGWCDPMWQGSVLTLELANMTRYHPIQLVAGMKIGQMCFYKHDRVPHDKSYAVRGQYNNQKTVLDSQGVK